MTGSMLGMIGLIEDCSDIIRVLREERTAGRRGIFLEANLLTYHRFLLDDVQVEVDVLLKLGEDFAKELIREFIHMAEHITHQCHTYR